MDNLEAKILEQIEEINIQTDINEALKLIKAGGFTIFRDEVSLYIQSLPMENGEMMTRPWMFKDRHLGLFSFSAIMLEEHEINQDVE